MVGRSQYRQPGSRTSPSIQRQVRTEAPAGAVSEVRSVIAMPSAGRSGGRSPGRRGWATPPARPPSHRAQAQGSRERLPGSVVAACGAFWPLPKSADSPLSRSWQECTMTACGDVAPVAGNGWGSICPTFPQCQVNTAQLLAAAAGRRPDGRGWVIARRGLLGRVRILGPVGETSRAVRVAEHKMWCLFPHLPHRSRL
jgi:hypothetical protein